MTDHPWFRFSNSLQINFQQKLLIFFKKLCYYCFSNYLSLHHILNRSYIIIYLSLNCCLDKKICTTFPGPSHSNPVMCGPKTNSPELPYDLNHLFWVFIFIPKQRDSHISTQQQNPVVNSHISHSLFFCCN